MGKLMNKIGKYAKSPEAKKFEKKMIAQGERPADEGEDLQRIQEV
jgi:hypothetical protein